ncbi:MAG: GNAT family N-acetyltransferase [Bacteroidales bacterium]|nr:GNAT family N-acetyltransferase [Bacteroidales bacterium]
MQRILFRADASAAIGYGHFFRTLALIDMLKDDFECILYLFEPSASQLEQASGVCSTVTLKDRFSDFPSHIQSGDTVVLDNYFFDGQYQQRLKDIGCTLVCIDDMHTRDFHADLIINHGFASPGQYSAPKGTAFCIGPEWALLRPPFLNRRIPENRKGVCICFGGSDPLGLADKIAALIPEYSPIVIKGTSRTADEMAEIFGNCELCILSASSVCYEALSCGARVIAAWYVDNQKDFYNGLVSNNMASGIGCLARQLPDAGELRRLIEESQRATCATGRNIRNNYVTVFHAISCPPADAALMRADFESSGFRFVNYVNLTERQKIEILDIRNSSQVRRWMSNPAAIGKENHLAYIDKLGQHSRNFYWAVFDGDTLCGGVSLVNYDGISADEGIFLDPSLCGKGLGSRISRASFRHYFTDLGIKMLYSVVHKGNSAAIRMDRKLGFTVGEPDGDFCPITLSLADWTRGIPDEM